MTDEQAVPIYLSPEEELTSVRERLEKTQARKIILVIPPQTQLRSHVGWRLIHARMRELGKDLLVISPDRQVRAVARAAGFRVAESQETPSNRSRLGSSTRPGSINTRGAARSRIGSSRGGPDSQVPQKPSGRRLQTPGASSRRLTQPPGPEPMDFEDDTTLERPNQKNLVPEEGRPIAPASFFEEPEEKAGTSFPRINTTPSVRPSVPGREEEEEDRRYYEDYHTAQQIRESATGSGSGVQTGKSGPPVSRGAKESWVTTARKWGADPLAYLEDEQQRSPLPEQKGSVPGSLDELEENVPDISDRSTEIMENEIEDMGDMGAIDLPEVRSTREPAVQPRERGARPRPPTGQIRPHSPRAPRPMLDFDDDDELLAIPDRPTMGAMQPPRPSRGLPEAVQRPSQALQLGVAPQVGQRPSQVLKPGTAPQSGQSARAAPAGLKAPDRQLLPPSSARSRQQPATPRRARRGNRGLGIAFTILILLLLVIGLLFYFVPTATVTISLQAQTFSQTVHLNATTDPHANVPNRVPAQALENNFSASGQGTASGTTRVGNARAQGLVTFTNNGSTDVTIPTNTLIATQSGIQFTTSAEAFVPHGSTFPAVPVSAQQTGDSGNVPTGSITVIPPASITSIAQYNHTSAQTINLAVKNSQATSGGGARNEPAVTQRDLQALTHTLHKKLQQEVNAWLTTLTQTGDLHGTPVPNLLSSAGPIPEEQLSGAPGINQATSNGTFSGTLSLHIKVLVARAAALKSAAGSLLNAAALKLSPISMLATRLPVTLTDAQVTLSKDGNALAIKAKATGAIVRQVSTQDISNALIGKEIGQVASNLKGSMAQAGIQDVQTNVSPSFLSIMPLRADRIQVILQPVLQTPPKNVPNG